MLSEMVRVPLLTAQKLLILPAHPLPPEVVRAELQVDRPVCPVCPDSHVLPPQVVQAELQVDCPVCPDSHVLPLEVVQAELQVDRPVCPTFLLVTLPLVQTLSLEAQVLLLLLETLLGQSLGPLRLLAV
jgi:hypothetical protein